MRHVLIALLILALCLSLGIFSSYQIRSAIAPTLSTLRLARTHAARGHYIFAFDAVEDAAEQWRKNDTLFGIFLSHDETDEVIRAFARLSEYARYAEDEEFAGTCAELISTLQHIRAMQLPEVKNLL